MPQGELSIVVLETNDADGAPASWRMIAHVAAPLLALGVDPQIPM
jgi:hypothetical protein